LVDAAGGFVATAPFVVSALAWLPAGNRFAVASALFGAASLFDALFLADLLRGFFVAGFLDAFFAFRAPTFAPVARFFSAAGLAARFDLRARLRAFFLTAFFLAFATTISFCSHKIVGNEQHRRA
jgi:hypothetical protein